MNWTDVPDCDVPLIVVETEVWPAWRKVLADLEQIPKWENWVPYWGIMLKLGVTR